MSVYIPVHFINSYSTNVQLLLQERGGKLAECVMIGTHTGEMASPVDQVGAVKAQRVTTRHGDTPLISTPGDRRWVQPSDWDWGDLIDKVDRLRLLIDPQSAYTQNGVMALRRAQDDEILAAFYGVAKTGVTGAVNVAFNTALVGAGGNVIGPTVGASGNTGLNVAKIRAARKYFMSKHVDLDYEDLYIAVTAEEHDDLLAETQIVNLDYTERPVLTEGKITRFLGFTFKHIEFGDVAFYDAAPSMISGTVNYCPAWVKSGMHLGIWQDLVVRVAERPDKRFSTQVYVCGTYGATRLEEKKILRIDCDTA